MIKLGEKVFDFDREFYKKSFNENIVCSCSDKDIVESNAIFKIVNLNKEYIGYKDGILFVSNSLMKYSIAKTKAKKESYISLPRSITSKFKTIVFEDGVNWLAFTVTSENKNIVFPDSFQYLPNDRLFKIVDSSGVEYIRFPKVIKSCSDLFESKNFPNLKQVVLPTCYKELECPILISGEDKRFDDYKKDGLLIIQNCLYKIDSKDEIVYIPESVTTINCSFVDNSVKTIIVSPNTRFIDFHQSFNSKELSLYCPKSIEYVVLNGCTVYCDGKSTAFINKVPFYFFPQMTAVTRDFTYSDGYSSSDGHAQQTDNYNLEILENLRRLFNTHYKIIEQNCDRKTVRVSHINQDNIDEICDAHDIYIIPDPDTNEASIQFTKHVSFSNLENIYIDKNIKRLLLQYSYFGCNEMMRGFHIYYDASYLKLIDILDKKAIRYCKATIHCLDRTFVFGDLERERREQEIRSHIKTSFGYPWINGGNIINKYNYNVVLTSDCCWEPDFRLSEEEFHKNYSKINFPDTIIKYYTHYFDKDEQIEDNVCHDFIASYYSYHMYTVFDFFPMVLNKGTLLNNENIEKICEIYENIADKNPSFTKYNKDQITTILNGLICYPIMPVVTNTDDSEVLAFFTIANIENVPLLLLYAIFHVLFKFKSVDHSFRFMNESTIIYKISKNQTAATFYYRTNAKCASEFSGFPISDFDKDKIGIQDDKEFDFGRF